MSQAPQTDPIETLNQTLYSEVFVPYFIKAAADRGITIRNEQELEAAFEICTAVEQTKQAQSQQQGSLLQKAAAALRGEQAPDPQVREFASQAARNDRVLSALRGVRDHAA